MTIKHVGFDTPGYISAASLTGSYADFLTMTDDADCLMVFNTSDKTFLLQVPSKAERSTTISTAEIYCLPGQPFVLDLRTNKKRLCKGVIQIKHNGVVPTAGEISATVFR